MQQSEILADPINARRSSIVIPRINQSHQNVSKFAKKQANNIEISNPNFEISEASLFYSEKYEPNHSKKMSKKPFQQCKQNLTPQIIQQKKLEMSQRNCLTGARTLANSYQKSLQETRQQLQTQPKVSRRKNPSSYQTGCFNMDSVCSKMTESIILSSDTLDSLVEQPASLSVELFDKIRFLGQGKFGQVHLVRHKQTGFICALKIIDKQVVKQQKVQSQIAKQLRIHSQLRSMNIIDFYGFFDDQNYFYILLEYATEGSVFSKLKGRSRLQQSEILPIAKGLCDGLRFMHRMGFIHRDIKPQNIVLQFGVPKICDFGWATDCDDMHLCKSYCGTPLYLSPQMVKKQFYGTSVDIWAVGLVVYQLLVGRVPFSIWSQQDMQQIVLKSIQFPNYIDRSLQCEQFIRKCLEKQTFNRMQLNQALRHPFLNQEQKVNLEYQFFQSFNKIYNNQ